MSNFTITGSITIGGTYNGLTITNGNITGGTYNGTAITGTSFTGGTFSGSSFTGGTVSGTTFTGTSFNGVTIDNNAWTAYTPTVTAGTGTFTTVSAVGRYKQIGKVVHFIVTITCTTVGSAASYVLFTLPVTANTTATLGFGGRETAINGSSLGGSLISSTQAIIQYYNATFPGASGSVLAVGGTYEAA